MNLDHGAFRAAQSPQLDLSTFGSADKPFLILPSLHGAAAPTAAKSDPMPGPSAAALESPPPSPSSAAADFSPSLRAVLDRRAVQIAAGYDRQHDDQLPLGYLLNEAMRYGADCRDWIANRSKDPGQAHFRHKLLSFVALGLAELERLDRKVRPDG